MHESLGEILKKHRSASGSTIEDVASRTKIPRPVIEALEAENFGYFNSPLYARSFLKQYSEHIGANVDHWLADFVPAVMIDSDAVESILGGPESPSEHSASPEAEKSTAAIWAPIWIFFITIAIIWVGVEIYEKLDSEHKPTEPHKSPADIRQPIPEETSPTNPVVPNQETDIEPPAQ